MNRDKAIYRSARTLFEVSCQRGLFDRVVEDLREVCAAVAANTDLERALADRALPRDRRGALINSLWGHGRVCALTLEFLRRAEHWHLMDCLPRMLEHLEEWYERHHGRMQARVASAGVLTPEQSAVLTEQLERIFHSKVSVTWKVDPALLAGFRIHAGGRVFDFTGSARLQQIRRRWVGAA